MVKKVSEVPEGVKILAFLFFAGAVISLAIGSFVLSLADSVRAMDAALLAESGLGQIQPWMIALFGLFLLGVSVLDYFIGRDLLRAQNWARIALGIFMVLGFVSSVMSLFSGAYISGTFSLIVNGVILWYFFGKKETKNFFR